jgi:hypothetical protein
MANRKQSNDLVETAVLPLHLRPDVEALDDAASDTQRRYEEYLRSLDDIPVLVDVVREAPRTNVRDFRSGQRRDERRAARDDASALRERHACETAVRYAEYVELGAALATTERAPPHKASPKTSRKSGAQKKRAKRAKRPARSKS